jgi:hypothetical protein
MDTYGGVPLLGGIGGKVKRQNFMNFFEKTFALDAVSGQNTSTL